MSTNTNFTQQAANRLGRGPGLRNIAPLLRHLSGQNLHLEVELKNGRIFHGILYSCDDSMNTILEKASRLVSYHKLHNYKERNEGTIDKKYYGNGQGIGDSNVSYDYELGKMKSSPKRQKLNLADGIKIVPTQQLVGDVSKFDTNKHHDCLPIQEYDLLHIRGSNIRYFHLPHEANVPALIRQGVDRERAAANKYKRGKRK